MSLVHGTVTCLLSGRELLRAGLLSPVDASNTAQQTAIMQLSCAYFALDTATVLLFRLNPMFVVHHVMTLSYMTWSMALGVGGHGVMALMCIGEVRGHQDPLTWLTMPLHIRDSDAHGIRALIHRSQARC